MKNKQELKNLAEQLRNPNGQDGIEMAETMHETNIQMTRHAIDLLNVKAGDTILELGHGSCKHLPYIMKQQPNLTYYGLETSELMFCEAKRINCECVENKNAYFHHYDGNLLPFKDPIFDKVMTVNTIYFWDNPKELLNELYRVIKSNGLLNITYAEQDFMQSLPFTSYVFKLYNLETIKQLVNQTRFKISESATLTEKVRSKAGDFVEREFTTVSLVK